MKSSKVNWTSHVLVVVVKKKQRIVMRLVEFTNNRQIVIRAILIEKPDEKSDLALVCVPGFEGLGSTAPKFIHLIDQLRQSSISCFVRYDPTGIGLSDGNYRDTFIETLVDDLSTVMNSLLKTYQRFIFVGHSLGSCVISEYLRQNRQVQVENLILLAPALNQSELHRYWYMMENHRCSSWTEFQQIFNEDEFQNYLKTTPVDGYRSARSHRISYRFVRECSAKNYSLTLKEFYSKILLVNGDRDPVVPLESIKDEFPHRLIVSSDDHDLERPDILEQWVSHVVKCIFSNKIII